MEVANAKRKSLRFILNQTRRYVSIPIRSLFKTTTFPIDLNSGFVDHRGKCDLVLVTPDQIVRIIKAYKAAKAGQKNAALGFEIKGLWQEWIDVNFKILITALKNEDIESLSQLFNNLLREQCTIGLGGYDEWIRFNSFLGKSYIKTVWLGYFHKLVDLQGDQAINFPMVGNPCGIVYKGKVIPIEALRHAYRAQELINCLSDISNPKIVEIGGGYGGLAYQLKSKLDRAQFRLFDIPEVAAISSAFLLASLPDKKFRLFGEGSVEDSLEAYEIGIFPNFSIDEVSDNSVDLFYNSCSFSEMDGSSARKYLSVVERCAHRYFMHDNHETAFRFLQPDGSVSINVAGSQLIPDPRLFKRIYKKPRTHGLPEDGSFKHFEYLYEKF